MIFTIIEIARIMYIYNTLQEVTRRAATAAAMSDFSDLDKTAVIRQNAIFRNSPGQLIFGAPVTDLNVRIDYLALTRQSNGSTTMAPIATSALPSCPGRNRQICMNDPNASNCIRFVRVRVCSTTNTARPSRSWCRCRSSCRQRRPSCRPNRWASRLAWGRVPDARRAPCRADLHPVPLPLITWDQISFDHQLLIEKE
jgi:hypothetical protein